MWKSAAPCSKVLETQSLRTLRRRMNGNCPSAGPALGAGAVSKEPADVSTPPSECDDRGQARLTHPQRPHPTTAWQTRGIHILPEARRGREAARVGQWVQTQLCPLPRPTPSTTASPRAQLPAPLSPCPSPLFSLAPVTFCPSIVGLGVPCQRSVRPQLLERGLAHRRRSRSWPREKLSLS